jgi:hypothetical protein
LRAGAKGYISKQEATGNIVEAARQVLGGRVYLSSRMSDQMLHRLVSSGEEAERSPGNRTRDHRGDAATPESLEPEIGDRGQRDGEDRRKRELRGHGRDVHYGRVRPPGAAGFTAVSWLSLRAARAA